MKNNNNFIISLINLNNNNIKKNFYHLNLNFTFSS